MENNPENLSGGEKLNEPAFVNPSLQNLDKITSAVQQARIEIRKYVIGQDEMCELLLIGILCNGHVLLEGVPGIAKTLTAKVLAKTLNAKFARIQFTPDLMPSDIIGTSVYNLQNGSFTFKRGPIFCNIVLIDEINRAPAKTQAALFEVMEERQVTHDGTTNVLEFPFLVLATQNPVEQEGTYRLPEAQLDRFLFRIKLHYPSKTEEVDILSRYRESLGSPDLDLVQHVFSPASLKDIQQKVTKVSISDAILKYIAEIVTQTREHGNLFLGASPRASLALMRTSKALAALRGRDFVTPDDVQFLTQHVLNHRIILTPEAEMEGVTPEDVVREIIQKVEVPR
ncbi:MAG: AAA family ATPase [Flavobacteriales bacterium]